METSSLTEKLSQIFIEEKFGKPSTDNDYLGINHGIQITAI